MHDDDQELDMQLRRRRLRSRRLTLTAMSPTISQHSSHSDISDEGVILRAKVRRQTSTEPAGGMQTYFKERAKQRRTIMSNLRHAKTVDHGIKGSVHSKLASDFPGLDPANRPHSTGDLEMRQHKPLGTIAEMDNGNMVLESGSTEDDRRPMSDPNVMTVDETHPLMPVTKPQPLPPSKPSPQHKAASTSSGKPATPPKPSKVPPPRRKKHLLSKSHPVDIEDDQDDDNFESSV